MTHSHSAQTKPKKWIMACIDDSSLSNAVVDYAAWLAQAFGQPLEVLHTLEHPIQHNSHNHSGNLTPNQQEWLTKSLSEEDQVLNKQRIQHGKDILANAQLRLTDFQQQATQQGLNGLVEYVTKQRHGTLTDTLTDLQDNIKVLVLGMNGTQSQTIKEPNKSANTIGSQIEDAIKLLHKPILIVNQTFSTPNSIMLAFNDTPGAHLALEMICASPLCKTLKVHAVHVTDNLQKGQILIEQARQKLTTAGVTFQTALLQGQAHTALLDYQQQHNLDLTVMGAFNHGKLHTLLFGSVTAKMLQHTQKPLLLLR